MTRPRLLDLYCCEGGASRGYDRAGFEVFGVDLFTVLKGGFSRKRYPYPSFEGDALSFLDGMLCGFGTLFDSRGAKFFLSDFQAIHASPPCQHASAGTRAQDRSKYPALIEPTRALLDEIDLPYVIENVKGAALLNPQMLCGSMFDLTAVDDDGTKLHLQRHRLFETNWDFKAPAHECWPRGVQIAGSYGGARRNKDEARNVRHGGYVPARHVQRELLGIDGMTERGMYQALPPIYTEFIGKQLLTHLASREAAA